MSTLITCPNCYHQFEPTDALSKSIETEMRGKMTLEWNKKIEGLNADKKQLENLQKELLQQKEAQEKELKKKVEAAKAEQEAMLKKELSLQLQSDFQHQLQLKEEAKKEAEEKLKTQRQKEVDFLKKIQEMEEIKSRLEIETQKQLIEERGKILEEVKAIEDERYKLREQEHQMNMKEMEKQLADQKRLAEEALRKAEQGSMQLQGEVQEIELEHLLRQSFPFDSVAEVGKGVRGADCVLTVRNSIGAECGTIIFESKRTKDFGGDWIDKLKLDMVAKNADLGMIVSQAMPKDMDKFGEKQGIYICNFSEVKSLVAILRQAVIKVFEAKKSQENKGDKMVALYDYLTGSEFYAQWNAIRESFQNFRDTLQKERDDFEKNWKKKQKLLDNIINNSLQISGSIEGISGMDSLGWNETGKLLE
jgi:hypothetical protein